jgi:hypothetical protein
MKKIKSLLIAIPMIIVAGCSLKEEPYGFLTFENFYRTEADAESAIMYCYAILSDKASYDRHLFILAEVPTESLTLKSGASVDQHDIDRLKTTATNEVIENVWRSSYSGINRANSVIENVEKVTMNIDYRNQILGEAYFLRALNYFNLVRLFGSVVLHTSYIDHLSETSGALAPVNEIYNLIIEDLGKATNLMDLTHRPGRANKVAAEALLAKVYLTLASSKATGVAGYEFVPSADDYYNNAKTHAAYVLTNQTVYGFVGNIKAIWGDANELNREFIFQVAHDKTGKDEGEWTQFPLLLTPYNSGADFTLADGTRMRSGWEHMQTEAQFFASWPNADKRKTDLICTRIVTSSGDKTYPGGGLAYPFTLKYIYPNSNGQKCSNDFPVIRYSDIMLVYAEAAGPTAESYDLINDIRARAGLPDLTANLPIQNFRDSVLAERTYELAFEGHRLFDLRRTKRMESVLVTQYGKTAEENLYAYKIPQNEVIYNDKLN